jgi:hypothetical protein
MSSPQVVERQSNACHPPSEHLVPSNFLTLSNTTGGTWRVAYNGEVSAALAPTITAAQLKSTLDGFNGIDNVTVTGSGGSFTVTFGGTQSTKNMQQIFGDAANASNGSTLRTITTAYNAASLRIVWNAVADTRSRQRFSEPVGAWGRSGRSTTPSRAVRSRFRSDSERELCVNSGGS